MNKSDHVVMITGAAGSLGRATAEIFLASGARCALLDLSHAALDAAYPAADENRLKLGVDLLDAAAVNGAVQLAAERFGRIDALCNIAGGFTMGTPVHATPAADWKRMLDLNTTTLLNAVQAVVPHMLAAGAGRIVNVGAASAQKGNALMGAYGVSKSAVMRITEAMSAELREHNINVNCVLPSIIDTPPNRAAMPEADPQKWVTPADLARVIAFLCSDDARAIHGAAVPVVGLS